MSFINGHIQYVNYNIRKSFLNIFLQNCHASCAVYVFIQCEKIPVQNNSATLKKTNVAQNHIVNRFKDNLQFHGKQHQMFEHLGD